MRDLNPSYNKNYLVKRKLKYTLYNHKFFNLNYSLLKDNIYIKYFIKKTQEIHIHSHSNLENNFPF
jgi:hypothetical protein